MRSLARLIEVNNQYYPDLTLSLSTGIATSRTGERLEAVVKRADMEMLQAKRSYYAQPDRDRRSAGHGVGKRGNRRAYVGDIATGTMISSCTTQTPLRSRYLGR